MRSKCSKLCKRISVASKANVASVASKANVASVASVAIAANVVHVMLQTLLLYYHN